MRRRGFIARNSSFLILLDKLFLKVGRPRSFAPTVAINRLSTELNKILDVTVGQRLQASYADSAATKFAQRSGLIRE
jgi:hypothetical protein